MAIDTADAGAGTVRHARATVKPEKAAAVAALAAAFRGSSAAVLTEYRGLTVAQISELRVALGADTTYSVVKNTLTKIAAADAGVEGVEDLLEGPTAVAFIAGEPVQAAKALRDFAKAHPVLVVKGGVMDGRTITAQEINKLADLESREVLLAKMAGALLASLSNAATLFNAPLVQAARVLGALQAKAAEDPSVLQAAAPEAPAPEADAPEAVAPEAAEASAPEAAVPEASAPEEAVEAAVPAADSPATENAAADSPTTENAATDSPTDAPDAAPNDAPSTA